MNCQKVFIKKKKFQNQKSLVFKRLNLEMVNVVLSETRKENNLHTLFQKFLRLATTGLKNLGCGRLVLGRLCLEQHLPSACPNGDETGNTGNKTVLLWNYTAPKVK